jgi:hypothetical protein
MKSVKSAHLHFDRVTATQTLMKSDTYQQSTQEPFFLGGVQEIRLRTEGRENGDLGAAAPIRGSAQFPNE